MKDKIAVLIIAAGYSSRMNYFKPLLRFGEETAIERLIDMYRRSGVKNVYVVTGHRSKDIMETLIDHEVNIVFNENYDMGMLSSIKEGVANLEEDIDGFFMQPVDIPLVRVQTIQRMIWKYKECDKGIVYPVFDGKRGHPPLIDCKYKLKIIESDSDGGLKKILKLFEKDAVDISVFDKTILMDMDFETDYEELLDYYNRPPSYEESMEIMRFYEVPRHIVRHCQAVERVCSMIVDKLNICGVYLDKELLTAASILHDIARCEKNHAFVGAELLRELGYDEVAEIVESHMDISYVKEEPINEKEVLYIADKMVNGEIRCTINERFEKSISRNMNNKKVLEKIIKRWGAAKGIADKIEAVTGKRID